MRPNVLPASEIHRLDPRSKTHLLAPVTSDMALAVVEDGDRIVGSIAVLRLPVWEAAWIDPEHRGRAGTVRTLLGAAFAASAADYALAGADTDEVRGYLARLGRPMPFSYYVIRTGGE